MNHPSDEQCYKCQDTGYHLAKLRAMLALNEVPFIITNDNTIVLGNPIPLCPCECHKSPTVY